MKYQSKKKKDKWDERGQSWFLSFELSHPFHDKAVKWIGHGWQNLAKCLSPEPP
jgi:hypothetical protein